MHAAHVALNGAFAHPAPEFQQLASHTFSTPDAVLAHHLDDEYLNLVRIQGQPPLNKGLKPLVQGAT
jgi:hypothetical protein